MFSFHYDEAIFYVYAFSEPNNHIEALFLSETSTFVKWKHFTRNYTRFSDATRRLKERIRNSATFLGKLTKISGTINSAIKQQHNLAGVGGGVKGPIEEST